MSIWCSPNIKIGAIVETPTGRKGKIIKMLNGSVVDCFDRVTVEYLDSHDGADSVTLQPHHLRVCHGG